jgi:hypothetical protein
MGGHPRHVAGDDTRGGHMRDYFTTQIYPYGYPVDQAMRDAAAEGQVAELDPVARPVATSDPSSLTAIFRSPRSTRRRAGALRIRTRRRQTRSVRHP